MKNNPKVSIIYVDYESQETLLASIKSVFSSDTKTSFEIIVVDNSKKDKVSRELKKVERNIKYIKSNKNIGYGAGNNLGALHSNGEYLLILNPDTEVQKGCIDILVRFLEKNPETAIVAPTLINKKKRTFYQAGSKTLTPIRGIVALSFLNNLFPDNKISKKFYLRDLPKNKKREAGAVPGSAFLIRKDAFDEVGGYDENMFMYFEESELGKRIADGGYKIFITPKAKVLHKWQSKKVNSKKLLKEYHKSRFYYFNKNYGLHWALVVEAFGRLSKWHGLLAITILIGAFLRFYMLEDTMLFHGEIGHNYLAIRDIVADGKIPLVGPPTSHPWLSFGPLFYWIFTPILILSDFNPMSGAYFFAIIGTLLIVVNYIVINKLFRDERVAILSSFLISISPTFIQFSRGSRFFSLVVLFFYPFLYFFVKSIKENSKYLFAAGLFFGIMLNFHLTPLIFIPTIILLMYLKRKRISKHNIIAGFIGLLIPSIPLIIHDILNGFQMIAKLAVWIPYRIVGFIGLYPKNNVTTEIAFNNVGGLVDFISREFVIVSGTFQIVIFTLFILIFVYSAWKSRKNVVVALMAIMLVLGYASIFVHGNPPQHYFLPLLPIPIILLSKGFIDIFNKRNNTLLMIVLIAIISINATRYFSKDWFYVETAFVRGNAFYKEQGIIVDAITKDAKGNKMAVKRVGPSDDLPGNYAQNYQYLLWLMGNEPVVVGDTVVDASVDPKLEYTIYEDGGDISEDEVILIEYGDVVVTRKEL